MKKLRNRFERFCFLNRNKGIPNLMLYMCVGAAVVYLISRFSNSYFLPNLLCFDRDSILRGEVWRLFTFPFAYAFEMPSLLGDPNILVVGITLFCYYSLGQAVENAWGTFRFNLFYFTGMLLMDAFCLLFNGHSSAFHLHLSLLLVFATMYPDAQFLLMYIIPIKAWVLALIYIALIIYDCIYGNFFSLVAVGNYFLFFGKDVLNIIPMSWRIKLSRSFSKKSKPAAKGKTIPFPGGTYNPAPPREKAPYTHKCTICGRTDISHPGLEFRYCSRCQGFHCYCQDHISNHTHIE